MPPGIAFMINAFQGMQETRRPADSLPEATPPSGAAVAGDEGITEVTSKEPAVTLSQVEVLLEAKLQALEERLLKYIDSKLDELAREFKQKTEIDLMQSEKEDGGSVVPTMNRSAGHIESEHNSHSVTIHVKEES